MGIDIVAPGIYHAVVIPLTVVIVLQQGDVLEVTLLGVFVHLKTVEEVSYIGEDDGPKSHQTVEVLGYHWGTAYLSGAFRLLQEVLVSPQKELLDLFEVN